MKVCILGAGGCFGQNLAIYLTRKGYTVMGIGRSPMKAEPYSLGFKYDYRVHHMVDNFYQGWTEIELFNPEVIISFAAHAGLVPQSWIFPEAFYATNTLLPVKIAKRLPQETRYIHIGSSEVYGSNDRPVGEEAPVRCSSPYAVSKAAADLHLMTLKDDRITIIRPSNCYCPGQSLHRLIPRAVLSAISRQKMPLAGSAQKSYMHSEDLSSAIELLLRHPKPGVFNVGPENPIGIHKVVSMVAEAFEMGLDDIAEVKPGRVNEDQCYWISSEKIMRLGWKPMISMKEGIEDMAKWGRKYAERLLSMSTEYRFSP